MNEITLVDTTTTVTNAVTIGDVTLAASQPNYAPLKPTVTGRTLDVSATGEAGLDWANIGAPTTTVDLSGTTIKNVDNAIANVTTVTGNVNGNVAGSVGSVLGNVAGSVASVVGSVGGNVVGSVANVLAFAQTALAQMFTVNTGETYADSVPGSVVYEIAQNAATDITPVLNRLPTALVSGKMDSSVHDFQTAALAEFFTTDTGETGPDAVPGSIVYEIASDIVISTDTSSFSGAAAVQIDEMQAKLNSLDTAQLTAISPTGPGATIQVTRGMDYYSEDGFAYSFTLPESGADLTGATGILYISTGGTPLAITSYSLNAVTRVVIFQLSSTESAKAAGTTCEIDVTLANTHIWKVAVGSMTVTTGLAI